MNKYLTTLIIILLLPKNLYAQKEDNIWIFGRGHGLDFNFTPPKPFVSQVTTYEGSAAVCDKGGQLLFYSNGNNVRDRYERIMPNGHGIKGNYFDYDSASGGSATQGVGIMAFLTDPDRYYLFTLDAEENGIEGGSRYLRYSVINMKLNNGLGDIESGYKNIVLDSFVSEKMAFARGYGCFNWVIVHSIDSPVFHSFKISPEGIAGPFSSISGEGKDFSMGEMKISEKGNRLAFANCRTTNSLRSLHIYSFDNKTGMISDYKLLDTFSSLGYPYGVSFSPSGENLFITTPGDTGDLYQYDLSYLPDVDSVKAHRYIHAPKDTSTVNLNAMRIGPDGKIYIARLTYDHVSIYLRNTIAVINKPDLKAKDIDFVESAIDLPVDTSADFKYLGIGLPPFVKGRVEVFQHHRFITCDTISIEAPLPNAVHIWDDGDTSTYRQIIAPASTWVRTENQSLCLIDTFSVVQDTFSFDLGSDVMGICNGDIIQLQPSIPAANYMWHNGSTEERISVSGSGKYWVQIERNHCYVSDTIYVNIRFCNNCISIPNAFTPDGDNLNDYFKPIFRCGVLQYKLIIVNRYGQEIFVTNNPLSHWNGEFQGKNESMGAYYYLINVKFDTPNQEEEVYKGDIILIR